MPRPLGKCGVLWYNKSMKKVIKVLLSFIICAFVALTGFSNIASATQFTSLADGAKAAQCTGCPSDLFGDTGVFKQVTNTILYIVGIIAVIMLIIGGIKYVISGGDSKKVTDAKNTVLYAIIGLIISFLAFAIVNFVISSLPSSTTKTTGALVQTTSCK